MSAFPAVGRWCGLVVLSAGAAAVQTSSAQQASAPVFKIEPLPSPAGVDSMAPQLTVSGDRMILSWLESTGHHATLRYADRTAAGWSAPGTVVSGENVVANWADVPSVHALSDGQLIAQWLEKNSPDPEAYDLRLSISKDRGRTWTALRSPHRDQTKTQHGFASVFESGPAGFGLVWLDGRETAKAGGPMTLRAAEYLWGPPSGGPEVRLKPDPTAGASSEVRLKPDATAGKSLDPTGESVVAPRVCDCCPTAAATTANGAIVAFRNRTADEIRDIFVARYENGRWSAPAPVHSDGWKINGCPVNGPALGARGRDVVVAWFTGAGGVGRAFAAFSSDAGRTFGPPVRVDDEGSTGRVQVALLKDGSAAVSWIEFSKGPSQLRVRRVGRTGTRSPPVAIADGLGTQFPRMAAARDEIVFAWMENSRGSSRVRTARAALRP